MIIKEDAGIATGSVAIVAAGTALLAAFQHYNTNKIEERLLECYDDEFLTVTLDSEIEVSPLLSAFLRRSKLMKRIAKREKLILINNMETARLLKHHLSDYPIFGMLFSSSTKKYSGDKFFEEYDNVFKILGIARSTTAITWDGIIKAFATLGISKTVTSDAITDCAKVNLYFIALVMRQLLLYKNDIKSISFKSKSVAVRQQYGQK